MTVLTGFIDHLIFTFQVESLLEKMILEMICGLVVLETTLDHPMMELAGPNVLEQLLDIRLHGAIMSGLLLQVVPISTGLPADCHGQP